MSLSFLGREHELANAKLIELVEKCKIKKKLVKKISQHRVPVKIKPYSFLLIFEKPAKVINIDYEKRKVDVEMRTSLVSLDEYFPENEGTSVVQYNMSYEGFTGTLQFRGATIIEMSFGGDILDSLKAGMKKKAGNLNLNLPVGECF